ncbi:MAG: NAD-dependent epimerase/dehydratase family protein [Rhodospirillaceae bacterium]|nr:NAD-dependent epimerase/dehydratase family protein [Rhodospirillaceae bacterium]
MSHPVVTIAVTGATGFIGQHLVRALRRDGAGVKALTRRAQPSTPENLLGPLTWVPGSLDDDRAIGELLAGCDGVIHMAGAIKALSREHFLRDNTEGTRRIAAIAAGQKNPPRFIYVSSLAAREPRLSAYAASKREGEKAVAALRPKMSVSILRPPAVYGPGDTETLRLFAMAARGFALAPSVVNARFSIIHVEDLVSAILNLMPLRDDMGEPLEIDDGQPGGHDWPGVVTAAGHALQTTPTLIPIPAMAMYLGGAIGSLVAQVTGRPSILSWGKVPELLHPDWVAQGPSVPGWTPQWDLAKGFKNTVNWAISQGLLKSYS